LHFAQFETDLFRSKTFNDEFQIKIKRIRKKTFAISLRLKFDLVINEYSTPENPVRK